MRNVIAFILAAIMSAAIVFIAAMFFFPGEKKEDSEESAAPPVVLTVSQSDCRASLYHFTFSVGEEEYSLPCHYDAFELNGWALKNPTEKIAGDTNLTGVYMKKAQHSLKAEIINYSKDTIMCCKGQIHSVSANVGDFDRIVIPDAITCDRSTTPDFVMKSLGSPDFLDEDDEKITLTYQKAEFKNVKFMFYKKRSFGSSGKSAGNSQPFESGYYEHVVVLECRKDS